MVTSAQLGHTMPFMLYALENTNIRQRLKIHKLNTTQKMQQNKLPWFSLLLWHSARKLGWLILEPTRDTCYCCKQVALGHKFYVIFLII